MKYVGFLITNLYSPFYGDNKSKRFNEKTCSLLFFTCFYEHKNYFFDSFLRYLPSSKFIYQLA